MNDILKDVSMAHRIVVKVGTSTLTYEHGTMNLKLIDRLSMVLSDLRNQGKEIILVSSGAQGIALGKLGLAEKPKDTKGKQAIAAVGQCEIGDNDNLSAVVADLVDADLLVLFSDIDGLYDDDPHKNKNAKLLPTVYDIDEVRDVAGGAGTSRGTGGMVTKLEAAERATNAGIHMIIANGNNVDSLYDILDGKPVGTLFVSKNFDKEEE